MPTVLDRHANNLDSTVGVGGRLSGGASLPLATGYGATLRAMLDGLGFTGCPSPTQPLRFSVAKASAFNSFAQLSDVTKMTKFRCTGLAGDTLTGLSVTDGTTDQAFVAGDRIIGAIDAGHLGDLCAAINALESQSAPSGQINFFPSGVDDSAGLQAAMDAAGAAGGSRVRLRGSNSAVCKVKTPVVWDQNFVTLEFDPGMTISATSTALLVGYKRNCGSNGNPYSHGRHRVPLESIVTDGSFSAGTRWAINLNDRSVEVQGTPNSGAAFTLNIDFGSGLAVNTGSIAANPGADAATVAAAMTTAVASLAGHSDAGATCTGGPIGTAPVGYTFTGSLAGCAARVTINTRTGTWGTALLNVGQRVHPCFADTPLTCLYGGDTNHPTLHNWEQVTVLTIGWAIQADWTTVGKQPSGSNMSVNVGGAMEKSGHPANHALQFFNTGAGDTQALFRPLFDLTGVSPATPYEQGTQVSFDITGIKKSQQLQMGFAEQNLTTGVRRAWIWDQASNTFNEVTVTGSVTPGSTLRRPMMPTYSVGCAGLTAVLPTEFKGGLGDGTICGWHVSAESRFTSDGSGKMILRSNNTRPNFNAAFLTGTNNTLGMLRLIDTPGSLVVSASGLNYNYTGLLMNEALGNNDVTSGHRIVGTVAINSDIPYGHVISHLQPLEVSYEQVSTMLGSYAFGWLPGLVSYPIRFTNCKPQQSRQGSMKLSGAQAIIRHCMFQFPARFAIVASQTSLDIDDTFFAAGGTTEAGVYRDGGDVGPIADIYKGMRWDIEGSPVTIAYYYLKPNTGFTYQAHFIDSGISTLVGGKGIWVPQVTGSKPMTLTIDGFNQSTTVAHGTTLFQIDDANCSWTAQAVVGQPYKFGDGIGPGYCTTIAAAPPTTGAFVAGKHIVINAAPTSGGVHSWRCTTSGDYAATPPKWAAVPLGVEA